MRPCLTALIDLVKGYGVSVVLSTVTHLALARLGGFPAPEALGSVCEIAPDPPALFATLKRVPVRDLSAVDDAALAGRLRTESQAFLIVDNRMQARALFDSVRDLLPGAAHLSTLMVPAHRRTVLRVVRAPEGGSGVVPRLDIADRGGRGCRLSPGVAGGGD